MDKTITVKWVRSAIGRIDDQKKTIRGLGFKRLHQTLTLLDRPEIRGMINRVLHLVEVNPVRNSSEASNPAGIILEANPTTGETAEQRGIISNVVKE
jgi:large subunit ribosomal protein L30